MNEDKVIQEALANNYNFKPSYVLGNNGPLAKNLERYEVRPQQILLAEDIQTAFETNRHLVAEAATGTGKSFAFLLAAIEKSLATGKPVVIATHTIALQEQLFYKDIPFLVKHLGVPVQAALAKGRGNYISIRRSTVAKKSFDKAPLEVQEQYEKLQDWLKKTTDGSLTSLPFKPHPMLWGRVKSDTDQCLGERCPTYDICHFQNSRRKIEEAQIIVTNHSMVILDLKIKSEGLKGILPEYAHLVIDEAHELEGVARQALTFEMTQYTLADVFTEVYHDRGSGFLNSMYDRYAHLDLEALVSSGPTQPDPNRAVVVNSFKSVKTILESSTSLFDKVKTFLGTDKLKRFEKAGELNTDLADKIKDFLTHSKGLDSLLVNKNDKLALEFVRKRSTEILMGLDKILTLPTVADVKRGIENPEVVAWATTSGDVKKTVSLVCVPTFVKPILSRILFSKISSVVMTSATLATGGKDPFAMFKSTMGLRDPMERKLPPVFNYQKQAKIYLVSNMPEQVNPDYIKKIAEQVEKYVRLTRGGAFVLFTSFKVMLEVYKKTQVTFEMLGMPTFCQGGDISRSRMIDEFKASENGVLFGVDSFWQGCDVAGSALRNVIITKLPFPTPDDPLAKVHEEIYKKYKRNYFMERSLPSTAIKLKQGFGRLIRTSSDTGIVVILDSRIVQKKYGKFFLDSLPNCPIELTNA